MRRRRSILVASVAAGANLLLCLMAGPLVPGAPPWLPAAVGLSGSSILFAGILVLSRRPTVPGVRLAGACLAVGLFEGSLGIALLLPDPPIRGAVVGGLTALVSGLVFVGLAAYLSIRARRAAGDPTGFPPG